MGSGISAAFDPSAPDYGGTSPASPGRKALGQPSILMPLSFTTLVQRAVSNFSFSR